MNFIKNILYLLAGADREAIKYARSKERNSYLALGLAVLIPAFMAWFGMYYQIYWLGFDGTNQIIICCIWALIILIIDVLMVNTMTRPAKMFGVGTRRQTIVFLLKAFFRLCISILLGYFISQPLILKHYESEINEELLIIRKAKIDSIKSNTEGIIANFSSNDSIYLKTLRERENCLVLRVTCEQSGKDTILPCGRSSSYFGRGERYTMAMRELDSIRMVIAKEDSILKNIRKNKEDDSKILIDSIRRSPQNGYAIRQQALDNIERTPDGNIAFRHRLLMLLLIFLDSVAVIMKILMPYGRHDIELERQTIRDASLIEEETQKSKTEIDISNEKNESIKRIKIEAMRYRDLSSDFELDSTGRLKRVEDQIDEISKVWTLGRNDININFNTEIKVKEPVKIPEQYKGLIEAGLALIFLFIVAYKFASNDILWFTQSGIAVIILYQIFQDLNRALKN